METSVQFVDDPAIDTDDPLPPSPPTLDVLELNVKVWFVPGNNPPDDRFHRVQLRTLRTL